MNIKYYLELIRVRHWSKNLFIFAPAFFGFEYLTLEKIFLSILAFFLFSFASSCAYMINDIADLEVDLTHPEKKYRPLPSGKISKKNALMFCLIILFITFLISFSINLNFVLSVFIYIVINVFYSFYLKNVVILDVFCIATGFLLRIIAGAVATEIPMSKWILICGFLISLFLGFTKRRYELEVVGWSYRPVLTDYTKEFLDQMIAVVNPVTLISYILYTFDSETVMKFGNKLFLTTPFVLYGIFRYQYLIYSRKISGDPTTNLFSDFPFLISIVLWILSCGFVIYFKP